MILELMPDEKITFEFSLIENKINVEARIKTYTERLNGSKSIKDVREVTLLLMYQKEKLNSITNLLNKL